MDRAAIQAGCAHTHQRLVVADRGPGDLGEPQHVLGCAPVAVLDDRHHRLGLVATQTSEREVKTAANATR